MVSLRVLLTNQGRKVIVLEKNGGLYDASGMFFELDNLDLQELEGAEIMYSEVLDYNDSSIEARELLIEKVLELENMYDVKGYGDNRVSLRHWVVMNGVSRVRNTH